MNLFLNGNGMSVMVREKDIPAVKAALDVEKFQEAKGHPWHVIVEGRLEPNRYQGFHVKAPNLSRISFIKPKPIATTYPLPYAHPWSWHSPKPSPRCPRNTQCAAGACLNPSPTATAQPSW